MKPPAPPDVCEVKLTLRRLDREAREARKHWYAAREDTASVAGVWSRQLKAAVADLTERMWAAERALAAGAQRWREVLAARESMPVAERWSLADLEKWARPQGDT